MSIFDDLVSTLEDSAGVGAVIADRIYPLKFPVDVTFPCLTYQRISAPVTQAIDRTIHGQRSLIQLDHWAESYQECEDSAEAARTAILAMAGSTVTLSEVTLWNELDSSYEADAELYRRIQEWWFLHS